MTEQELKEIEARSNAATPGPWGFVPPRTEELAIKGEVHCDEGPIFVAAHYDIAKSADFEFAAHAREDIPKLIAEVRRLRDVAIGGAELHIKCPNCGVVTMTVCVGGKLRRPNQNSRKSKHGPMRRRRSVLIAEAGRDED